MRRLTSRRRFRRGQVLLTCYVFPPKKWFFPAVVEIIAHSPTAVISKKRVENKRRTRPWLVAGAAVVLIACIVCFGIRDARLRERTAWKTQVISHWQTGAEDSGEIEKEVETLQRTVVTQNPRWAGNRVLLMRDGEYLVYAFRHAPNNGLIDHLFLAHGSDGGWYYSTYHFCNQMAAVMADDPP